MSAAAETIRSRLFALQDLKYRDFHCALMPTVDKKSVIGVRVPALRALAKELAGTETAAAFLAELPHAYYEENNLHGLLIERMPGFDETLAALERFLPCIDNWATCDLIRPKAFRTHTDALMPCVRLWLQSGHTYTARFGIRMLMDFYLTDAFLPELPALVASCACGDYYIDMCVAWYFAEALYKQPDAILPYFSERRLPKWTHNKAIQKSIESFRIPAGTKAYLKTLRLG